MGGSDRGSRPTRKNNFWWGGCRKKTGVHSYPRKAFCNFQGGVVIVEGWKVHPTLAKLYEIFQVGWSLYQSGLSPHHVMVSHSQVDLQYLSRKRTTHLAPRRQVVPMSWVPTITHTKILTSVFAEVQSRICQSFYQPIYHSFGDWPVNFKVWFGGYWSKFSLPQGQFFENFTCCGASTFFHTLPAKSRFHPIDSQSNILKCRLYYYSWNVACSYEHTSFIGLNLF